MNSTKLQSIYRKTTSSTFEIYELKNQASGLLSAKLFDAIRAHIRNAYFIPLSDGNRKELRKFLVDANLSIKFENIYNKTDSLNNLNKISVQEWGNLLDDPIFQKHSTVIEELMQTEKLFFLHNPSEESGKTIELSKSVDLNNSRLKTTSPSIERIIVTIQVSR
jgi:hypothetical protein